MTEISKYITIIRPEFMTFCKDACRAAALNHLLFRIAYKCKDQPREKIQAGEVLWYAKTELITAEMSDAWGVCKVRKEVNALLAMNLFGRKSNPIWGVDRTKHFCFGSEQCEIFLGLCEANGICAVHLDLPSEVKHLIYSSLANDRTIKCTCEKQETEQANDKSITCIRYNHPMHSINLSPANDISIEAITKITTKRSTEDNYEEEGTYSERRSETSTIGADAPTPARVSHPEYDFIWFDDLMKPTVMWVRYTQAFPGPLFSEYEDKRRSRRSDELRCFFEGRGINVKVIYEHESGDERTVEASPAPSSSQVSPDEGREPYVPDFNASQEKPPTIQENLAETAAVLRRNNPVVVSKPAQATSQAAAPQRQSAYQAPPRGRGNKPKGNSSKQIYFSTEGSAFRGWYEELTGVVLDETAANARACNLLGQRASVTYENTKLVVNEVRTSKWVKRERVAVTVQDLASDDKALRWEKWLMAAQQSSQSAPIPAPPEPKPSNNPYDLANMMASRPLPTLGATL